jgi:hypothetical protein
VVRVGRWEGQSCVLDLTFVNRLTGIRDNVGNVDTDGDAGHRLGQMGMDTVDHTGSVRCMLVSHSGIQSYNY